ncbi:MAG: hypothetical protein ABIR70_10190 [Bryobacteraceae bacterium]
MHNGGAGGHLIETPAEREIREQAGERARQSKYRKLQVLFNAILTIATVLTGGMMLYQNHLIRLSLDETMKQSKASQDALAVARDTLTSNNESSDKTLAEIQKQVKAMSISADAAKDQADAATESNKINRISNESIVASAKKALDVSVEAAHLDQRAWLSVKETNIDGIGPNRPSTEVEMVFVNTGKTPAFDIHVVTQVEWVQVPQRPILKFSEGDATDVSTLFPDGISGSSVIVKLTEEERARIRSGKTRLYVAATIWYSDIFAKRHITEFCTFYDIEPEGLAACPFHNSAE